MSPIIKLPSEDEDIVTSNVRLKRGRWRELDRIAEHETEIWRKAGKKKKLSRNDIVQEFLDWACEHYWKEKGLPPGGAPKK